MTFDHLLRHWTFGCEHEFADWDRCRGLPKGFDVDDRDTTMVNSNGIAVDPKAKHYHLGGEIRTPPTSTPERQVECLWMILNMHPEAKVNYRSNLHVHVRVPGLAGDLDALKRLARYNSFWLRRTLPVIEPIPRPTREEYPSDEEYEGARRRYRRRRRSHQTILTGKRHLAQLGAEDIDAFMRAEVPANHEGRPLWHLQPRCAVNVRQLRETDTIEFRHFPGTLDSTELRVCTEWCTNWMIMALIEDGSPLELYRSIFQSRSWPQFAPYNHWMETRYRATVLDGSIPRAEAIENIHRILEGEFK